MSSIEKRLRELERTQPDKSAPCFWCACEDHKDPNTCEHRSWQQVPHETALAELT